MRIHTSTVAHLAPVAGPQPPAAEGYEATSLPSQRPDAAEFSDELAELRRVRAAAAAADEVRADRVAAIKARLQAGTYTIDTNTLAEKLLG